jgi:hypothetical protein
MGNYINQNSKGENLGASFNEKCESLESDGAVKIEHGTKIIFQPNLVCVVNNGIFAAAAHAYSEMEMKCFLEDCGRQKSWFIYEHAETLAN